MGDLPGLLLVVAVIYGLECLVWVRLGGVGFSRFWGTRWQIRHPGNLAGNRRGGFLLAWPFPPLGTFLIARLFPVSLSPEGLFSYVSACLNPLGRPLQTGQFIRWSDVRAIRADGKEVLVNDQVFFKAGSHVFARHVGGVLRRIHGAAQNNRPAVIKEVLADTLDKNLVTARLAEFQKRSKPLRVLTNVLFAYLFVLAPLLAWQYGFHLVWGLLIGLFIQTIPIAILFRRSHKVMLPSADEERFTYFMIMLLAPPTAIRAHDVLARHLLENLHPLAVARELCPSETFKNFARCVLLDLRFPMLPICPTSQAEPIVTEQWFRSALMEATENFLRAAALSPAELTPPARPADPENRSYCPRCEAQFVTTEGVCVDCGGRPLELFPPSKSEPAPQPVSKQPNEN